MFNLIILLYRNFLFWSFTLYGTIVLKRLLPSPYQFASKRNLEGNITRVKYVFGLCYYADGWRIHFLITLFALRSFVTLFFNVLFAFLCFLLHCIQINWIKYTFFVKSTIYAWNNSLRIHIKITFENMKKPGLYVVYLQITYESIWAAKRVKRP